MDNSMSKEKAKAWVKNHKGLLVYPYPYDLTYSSVGYPVRVVSYSYDPILDHSGFLDKSGQIYNLFDGTQVDWKWKIAYDFDAQLKTL